MAELGIQPPEPPPFPQPAPQPVLPLEPAAPVAPTGVRAPQPPPLPAAPGPYYKPPVYFQVEEPKPSREPQWVVWGIGGFIFLMIGAGGVAYVATRGPARAAARGTPPPTWAPARTAPVRSATPQAAPRPVAPAPVVPPPRPAPKPVGVNSAFPLVRLPEQRQVDQLLKSFWQAGESAGAKVKTIRTLKSVRLPEVNVQPVNGQMSCTFPQAVVFLQNARATMPAMVVQSFELTTLPADVGASAVTPSAATTVNFYFTNGPADPTPLCPHPDVAGALAEVASAAQGKFQFTKVAVQVDGAADASNSKLAAKLTLEGLGESDVEIANYFHTLSRSPRLRDRNLVMVDSASVADRPARRFVIEAYVKDAAPAMPVVAAEVADVFRAPKWMEPTGAWAVPAPVVRKPAAPAAVELDAAEAQRRVGQISLEAVIPGKPPSCVINGRLYRVGHQVNGLTIESIREDGVVLRAGSRRFEVKLKQP
jgi:hypothetical protein